MTNEKLDFNIYLQKSLYFLKNNEYDMCINTILDNNDNILNYNNIKNIDYRLTTTLVSYCKTKLNDENIFNVVMQSVNTDYFNDINTTDKIIREFVGMTILKNVIIYLFTNNNYKFFNTDNENILIVKDVLNKCYIGINDVEKIQYIIDLITEYSNTLCIKNNKKKIANILKEKEVQGLFRIFEMYESKITDNLKIFI